MNLYTGILVYVMIWWVVLFAVLPWGIRRSEVPEQPGHAIEAPSNPRMALRFAVTTVIATALFALTWLLIALDLISFRES